MSLTNLPFSHRRVFVDEDPYLHGPYRDWTGYSQWPAKWISLPDVVPPVVVAYRLRFTLDKDEKFLAHVTADERYELYLDGVRIGSGSERGDADCWFFETYELNVAAGEHIFVAKVWSLGEAAPFAQMSVAHGFLFCPQSETNEKLIPILATGHAHWEAKVLGGYEWKLDICAWGTGFNEKITGANYDWGFESGAGDNWISWDQSSGVIAVRAGSQGETSHFHGLQPAVLPPMLEEIRSGFTVRHVSEAAIPTADIPVLSVESIPAEAVLWQQLVNGEQSLHLPANTVRRVIVDLNEYFCGRFDLVVSGGKDAIVRIHWSEALYIEKQSWSKGNRDEIEGKFFAAINQQEDGVGDQLVVDGGRNRHYKPLWWQAGRYLEICVVTKDEAIEINSFSIVETRYPLEMESKFSSDYVALQNLTPMMVRVLQTCSHETYMDCPFYEQLMYIGDTRLEVLVTYAISSDDRLPKKALQLFNASRQRNGLTQSRYPTRIRQIIPPFSMWWICMVHDYALWRGEAEFVKSLLPGVRGVCDYFNSLIGEDGLMGTPQGWNFVDWVKPTGELTHYTVDDEQWPQGCAPEATHGISGVLNWQAVLAFKAAADLEAWFGELELAALQSRRAEKLANAVDLAFWNDKRGLYADDLTHQNWSEHSQCLAILSDLIPEAHTTRAAEGLVEAPDLKRTTIYFSHYLLETFRKIERIDKFFERLQSWNELVENGLKTTIESPEPTRSDCHAWGAHPLFHYFATIAGIRPAAPGFAKVEIAPQLGDLKTLDVTMPHPKGEIKVNVEGGKLEYVLPEGIQHI